MGTLRDRFFVRTKTKTHIPGCTFHYEIIM